MHIFDEACFLIVSQDAGKIADFRLAAERCGLLWKTLPGACQCFGRTAAKKLAAELITGLTFGIWEQRWLAELAKRRYDCFNPAELRLMLDKALCLTREDKFCWGLFAGERRHERLSVALMEQLQYCSRLDLDGFWRFRMEGYREYLQTLLSIAADEVLSEQEDAEYLRLLADFMGRQAPGGEIHVFLQRQGCYDICCQTAGRLHFIEGGRLHGCEDLLLYTLLQLAPQQLYMHTEQSLPPGLRQPLENVFGSRLQWDEKPAVLV